MQLFQFLFSEIPPPVTRDNNHVVSEASNEDKSGNQVKKK